jgi:hypothetical protein
MSIHVNSRWVSQEVPRTRNISEQGTTFRQPAAGPSSGWIRMVSVLELTFRQPKVEEIRLIRHGPPPGSVRQLGLWTSGSWPMVNSKHHWINQWPFQEPKLEVPTIYKAYLLGLWNSHGIPAPRPCERSPSTSCSPWPVGHKNSSDGTKNARLK